MTEVKLDAEAINDQIRKEVPQLASKEEKRSQVVKPVVSKDRLVVEKKPIVERIASFVVSDDTAEAIGYLFDSIIVPGAKNLALDALESFWFGGFRRDGIDRRRGRSDYYDYGTAYYESRGYSSSRGRRNRGYDDRYDRRDGDRRERKTYQNIVLKYSEDAEEIVDALRGEIREFGDVTVFKLLGLVDIQGSYVDQNWGWTDPRDIGVRRVSNGWLIDVADAKYLD